MRFCHYPSLPHAMIVKYDMYVCIYCVMLKCVLIDHSRLLLYAANMVMYVFAHGYNMTTDKPKRKYITSGTHFGDRDVSDVIGDADVAFCHSIERHEGENTRLTRARD